MNRKNNLSSKIQLISSESIPYPIYKLLPDCRGELDALIDFLANSLRPIILDYGDWLSFEIFCSKLCQKLSPNSISVTISPIPDNCKSLCGNAVLLFFYQDRGEMR